MRAIAKDFRKELAVSLRKEEGTERKEGLVYLAERSSDDESHALSRNGRCYLSADKPS